MIPSSAALAQKVFGKAGTELLVPLFAEGYEGMNKLRQQAVNLWHCDEHGGGRWGSLPSTIQ